MSRPATMGRPAGMTAALLALGVAVATVMLVLLLRQYDWLSSAVATTDPAEHEALVQTSYLWLTGGGLTATATVNLTGPLILGISMSFLAAYWLGLYLVRPAVVSR